VRGVTVRLISLDEDVGAFAAFVQGAVVPFAAGGDVDVVRTRELATVLAALAEPAHVVHLIARGDASDDFIGFNDGDDRTVLTVEELLLRAAGDERKFRAPGVIVDAPKSGSRRFVRAVRECITAPAAFVGAPGACGWPDSTLFAAAFYAAFFDGPSKPVAANVMRAADRARNAQRTATGRAAPLRGELVTPR